MMKAVFFFPGGAKACVDRTTVALDQKIWGGGEKQVQRRNCSQRKESRRSLFISRADSRAYPDA